MATLHERWAPGRGGTPTSHRQGLSPSCHTLPPPPPTNTLRDSEQDPPAQTLQLAPIQNSAQHSGLTGTHSNLPTHPPTTQLPDTYA